nr:hypothetical protein [Tanacetum cinerariifolium]
MDLNTSIGRSCLGESDHILLSDKIESEGNWDGPEYQDTTDSGKRKEVKAFTFHRMETEEVSERYITPCFVECLDTYDGETDLEYEKNMISNEFVVKLCLEYEVKNDEKLMKQELLVALKGEHYFVRFIINLEDDDVKPWVLIAHSFHRLTKGIAEFRNRILTIYLDLITFNDDSLGKTRSSIEID